LGREPVEPPAGVERAIQLIEEAHCERQCGGQARARADGMRENIVAGAF
jgi:hypothetical protein